MEEGDFFKEVGHLFHTWDLYEATMAIVRIPYGIYGICTWNCRFLGLKWRQDIMMTLLLPSFIHSYFPSHIKPHRELWLINVYTKIHFTKTLVVISHEINACSMFVLQVYLHASCVPCNQLKPKDAVMEKVTLSCNVTTNVLLTGFVPFL